MIITNDDAIDVAAITARLSELGEESALNYFWLMMHDGANPLTVLAWMSKVIIQRPPDWNFAEIRREHELGLGKSGAGRSACYGCGESERNLYFHHIIEVQNGGSNARRNVVPLCFSCHKTLHPWLTVEPKPSRGGGFIHLNTVMNDMFARMKLRK